MSGATPTEGEDRSSSLGGRVEALCDRFEAAWKAGRRPRIEDDLGEVPEPVRAELLRGLLGVELAYRRRNGERPMPEEYRHRFPDHPAVIDTVLVAAPPIRAARPRAGADRDLLFGLLALQLDFIDRDALVDAFHRRIGDRSKSLDRILLERGALSPSRHLLLAGLVEEHIKLHGDDPAKSLAALSPIGPVRADLSRVADGELHTSLAQVSAVRGNHDDPLRTMSQASLGASTSAGSRFRILRPHAKGGLGQVSVALDQELDRAVALKEIQDRHADDLHSRSRFVHEAEITGKLEHPGIIPVYGLGHDASGRPFYAMRFIQGDSLKEAIAAFHGDEGLKRDVAARGARLRELLRRFTDVCNAIAYAHSRGVLHRDLKPGNIMLGPYGETLVVDWGLAKPLGRTAAADPAPGDGSGLAEGPIRLSGPSGSRDETFAGTMVGTPAYASPEQVAGRHDLLGPASDVYGLGATLYALLTGRAPFEDRNRDVVLGKVRRGEFPPPRAVNRAIDPALEATCLKAMALGPEDRYVTPGALADDIEHWLAGEPVSAWREPWTVRARRWRAKHRPLVAAATAALVVALMAAAWGWNRVQVQEARDKTRGYSLAQAILAAQIGKVPTLVEQLEGYRRGADPLLVLHLKAESDDSPEKLRAALALVSVDARQVNYLSRRLLKASAEELLVIRDALKPSGHTLRPRLWALLGDSKADSDGRLRAAAALAAFGPDDGAGRRTARRSWTDWSRKTRRSSVSGPRPFGQPDRISSNNSPRPFKTGAGRRRSGPWRTT